jgi:uncharacterized coiled-coil protein SlyX
MSRRISLRLATAILTAVPLFPLTALGQSQGTQTESVADAARRAREKKKAAEKQPAPVITDDTLKPSAPASPEVNAPAPAPSSEAAPGPASGAKPAADSTPTGAANAEAAPGAPASDVDQKTQVPAELAGLKQQLADAQKGLELLQRDLALQQDTYISNPDHSHDTTGKAKLDAMQQQVAEKQQDVDALKARLAALQESPNSAAPPAPAPPTAPPQS